MFTLPTVRLRCHSNRCFCSRVSQMEGTPPNGQIKNKPSCCDCCLNIHFHQPARAAHTSVRMCFLWSLPVMLVGLVLHFISSALCSRTCWLSAWESWLNLKLRTGRSDLLRRLFEVVALTCLQTYIRTRPLPEGLCRWSVLVNHLLGGNNLS